MPTPSWRKGSPDDDDGRRAQGRGDLSLAAEVRIEFAVGQVMSQGEIPLGSMSTALAAAMPEEADRLRARLASIVDAVGDRP